MPEMKDIRDGIAYCRGWRKRVLDLCMASIGLTMSLPVVLIIAAVILAGMGRPILFQQERVGMDGRSFRLMKFRTMREKSTGRLPITGSGDHRITEIGRLLRAMKLDELPQLVNVLRGDMSIVGPRPEVPRYVATYTDAQRVVLMVRPGLTDEATVAFRDEERLLGLVDEGSREEYYVKTILPRKLALSLDYLRRAGIGADLWVMWRTALAVPRWRRS